jgi:hypothetical protein
MPIPEMKKINPKSSESQQKATLSSCIATEVKNGRPQDQAVAMCMEMMRKQTGIEESAPAQQSPSGLPSAGGV